LNTKFVFLLRIKLKFFQKQKNKIIQKPDYEWFKENVTRCEAESYLKNKKFGTFIVRKSETHSKSYVLSVKVPIYANSTNCSHYLIECNKRKKYSLKGVNVKFSSVNNIIQYYSKNRDTLPVLLDLNFE
jgi:hypothetical protein